MDNLIYPDHHHDRISEIVNQYPFPHTEQQQILILRSLVNLAENRNNYGVYISMSYYIIHNCYDLFLKSQILRKTWKEKAIEFGHVYTHRNTNICAEILQFIDKIDKDDSLLDYKEPDVE